LAAPDGPAIVAELRKFLGDEYIYGAAGPDTFDCSGLVYYGLTKLGFKGVPRTSEQQYQWATKITQADLQPGDLIFEQWPGDGPAPGHVIVYAGGGQVIEAPQPGGQVQLRKWSPSETTIVGYGRVPGVPGGGGGGGGLAGGLLSLALPQQVLDVFTAAEQVATGLAWLVNPENWVRIIAGLAGAALGLAGILVFMRAALWPCRSRRSTHWPARPVSARPRPLRRPRLPLPNPRATRTLPRPTRTAA
jgi:hypothetical protein